MTETDGNDATANSHFRKALASGEFPFLDLIEAEPVEIRPGRAVWRLTVLEKHLRSLGIVHGGVTATLLDTALGFAGALLAPCGGNPFEKLRWIRLVGPEGNALPTGHPGEVFGLVVVPVAKQTLSLLHQDSGVLAAIGFGVAAPALLGDQGAVALDGVLHFVRAVVQRAVGDIEGPCLPHQFTGP